MVCPKCDESRNLGYRYCPGCGEALNLCPECNAWRQSGARFCKACGNRLYHDGIQSVSGKPMSATDVLRGAATVSCLLIAVMMIIEVIAVITRTGEVFDLIDSGASNGILLLIPQIYTVATLSGTSLSIYWIFILLMFLASVCWTFVQSRGLLNENILHNPDKAEGTPLYWISLLFGSVIMMELGVIWIESLFGVTIDVPEGLPSDASGLAVFLYTEAGVWEEIVSRVIWIGLPMMIVGLLVRNPQPWRYLFGGFGLSKVSVALILISTIVFAFAHAEGWGMSKVPLVMFGGIVMGYIFVRFGLLASIFYHALTDLMSCAVTISPYLGSLTYLLILFIGLLCAIDVVRRLPGSIMSLKDLPTMDDGQDNNLFKRS